MVARFVSTVATLIRGACCPVLLTHFLVSLVYRYILPQTLVELRGFEPLTSSMPWKRATNCAIAPRTMFSLDDPKSKCEIGNQGAPTLCWVSRHRGSP